jgi:hypothetical protein
MTGRLLMGQDSAVMPLADRNGTSGRTPPALHFSGTSCRKGKAVQRIKLSPNWAPPSNGRDKTGGRLLRASLDLRSLNNGDAAW